MNSGGIFLQIMPYIQHNIYKVFLESKKLEEATKLIGYLHTYLNLQIFENFVEILEI